jgi:peptide chain release factor subunit 1
MELSYFYNRVAGTTREYFIDIYPVKGLIISGPGPTKEDFINGNYLEYRLQNMIINTIDAGYSGAEGIREAFAKSGELLSDFRMVEEKKLIEDLFREVNSHSGLGVYGLQDVIELLKNNVVKILIITDDTNLNRVEGICRRCQHLQEVIVERRDVIPKKTEYASKPCPGCNAMEVEPNEQDIVDYLELLAAKTGSRLEVVSGSAEHGTMLSSLGKVGAILRYNPGHTKEAKT